MSRRTSIVVGIGLGSLCLYLAFREVEWHALTAALAAMDFGLAFGALACVLAALLIVVLRWRALFSEHADKLDLANLLQATVVGQALNIVLPIRIGEFGKWLLLNRQELVPRSVVLATLVVEKGLDLLTIGLVSGVLIATEVLPEGLGERAGTRAGIAAAALLALWGLGRLKRVWMPGLRLFSARLPGRWQAGLGRAIEESGAVATALGRPVQGLGIAALSLSAVALSALANYLLMRAFGLALPFQSAIVLLLVLQVGAVPPSLPGRLGVFNYLTVLTLGRYGVDPSVAMSYSIALYVVALLSKLVWGTIYMVRGNLWREMRSNLVP